MVETNELLEFTKQILPTAPVKRITCLRFFKKYFTNYKILEIYVICFHTKYSKTTWRKLRFFQSTSNVAVTLFLTFEKVDMFLKRTWILYLSSGDQFRDPTIEEFYLSARTAANQPLTAINLKIVLVLHERSKLHFPRVRTTCRYSSSFYKNVYLGKARL